MSIQKKGKKMLGSDSDVINRQHIQGEIVISKHVQSMHIVCSDGKEMSVGEIEAGCHLFQAEKKETIQIIEGVVSVNIDMQTDGPFKAGDVFKIPEDTTFELDVGGEGIKYFCIYG